MSAYAPLSDGRSPSSSLASAGTLPLDPELPQLEAAWNPRRMREVFAATLRPDGGARFDFVDCLLSRFRYRQGTRAIMLYVLRLRDMLSGREHDQWVTGTIYPGKRTRRRYKQLCEELQQMPFLPSLPFAPVEFVPELNMLVQLFPVDRYMPTLPALASGPPPALEAQLLETFGAGHWQTEHCGVQTMRYRASFGATFRYTLEARNTDSGERATRCFYVKVYRDSGEPTFNLLQTLGKQCDGGAFGTVKPLAYLHDLRALVLDSAPGKPLDQALLDGDSISDSMDHAARALAAFHQSSLTVSGYRSKADGLTRVRRATTFIGWACPELSPSVSDIVAALEARLGESPRHPAHLDVKPDHLFLDGDRVTLIDLDSASLGDPMLDPASLLARLEALPHVSAVPEATARNAARVFADSYFACVPDAWRSSFGLSYACAALKVALFFVQHQQPEWRTRVTTFVERAGQGVSNPNVSPYF